MLYSSLGTRWECSVVMLVKALVYGTSKKKVSLGKDTLLDPGAVAISSSH